MIRALSIGASGMQAQQGKVDTIANNLANINTTGFKKSRTDFSELVTQEAEKNGLPVSSTGNLKIGSGVRIAEIIRDFTTGSLIETGRPLDLAIEGEGFFGVISAVGEKRFTRDGSFSLNKDGEMVTSSGYTLPGIKITPGAAGVSVSSDGTVTFQEAGSTKEAGRLQIYKFQNTAGLKAEGENLFSSDDTFGEAAAGYPGSEGFGSLRQGSLEAANVDLVEEMANLIEAQRAYGFTARTIRTADEMWNMANNLRK